MPGLATCLPSTNCRHVDLELQANNLFNQKQYTRVNYSGLDIHTQTSQLRPMNIVGTIRFGLL